MKIDGISPQTMYPAQHVNKAEDLGGNDSFGNALDSLTKEVNVKDDLGVSYDMMESLDKLKEKLDFDVTVENLRNYKEAVKTYLDHYTKNELQLEGKYLSDRRGYTKKLYMIKTVNEKLDSLTERMLETHQGHLETLKKVGEIQGLLVDLYL